MGEFSLSGNANIGLSAVEIPVNTSKSSTIFYTTPTSTSGTDSILQAGSRQMQDEEKGSSEEAPEKGKEDAELEKLEAASTKAAASLPLFHPAEGAPTLWSAAVEDSYAPMSVNGLGFQNFPSPNQQLFGNNQSQGRRAITASHNFPHMGRQSGHPLYKGYGSWASPGQSWSGGSSAWNRGRSVPNLTPLQQMGVAGRKPSPTFNHQQVISPVKFRRSTSYPGKGPFPQPPTFEITNMDEARDLLPYQVMCGTFEHCTVTLVIATLPVATR